MTFKVYFNNIFYTNGSDYQVDEGTLLNETTGIGIIYDGEEKNYIVDSKNMPKEVNEIMIKENNLEIEQHNLSENIDTLDLIEKNIKDKYNGIIISVVFEFCLLFVINLLVTPNNIISLTIVGIILSSINILVTTVFELINKSFKENYRLKKEVLPNLIKNNIDKISLLQKELDDMKKQAKFSKTNNLNIDEIDLSRINYSNSLKEKNRDSELSNIKIKNYDFNIN